MLIKVNDLVEVISGKDKGQRGRILKVDRANRKVVVEGLNRVYKHVKRSQRNPQGGRLSKEVFIDSSKVMLVCPTTGKPTRIGVRFLADGSKERFSKKSGQTISVVSPPRALHAKK
jgi:large subunit ribosomal protein L24